ncbi:MAG: stage III sporulation protein AA, partial [Clostridia bacterium]|nr:stage III sporulation protein AA [Clostridia bacterium]
LCDEISGAEWESVLEAQSCGAALIASAHGEGVRDVLARPGMKKLVTSGAFPLTVELKRGLPPEIKEFSP